MHVGQNIVVKNEQKPVQIHLKTCSNAFVKHVIICFTFSCSCSTQLRLKFILLINVIILIIVGILTFISRTDDRFWCLKTEISIDFGFTSIYE